MRMKQNMASRLSILCVLCLYPELLPAADDPFAVSVDVRTNDPGSRVVGVAFSVPAKHHVYARSLSVKAGEGVFLEKLSVPASRRLPESFGETNVDVYDSDFRVEYTARGIPKAFPVTVQYQGCDDQTCFLPVTRTFIVGVNRRTREVKETAPSAQLVSAWREQISRFKVSGKTTGYVGADDFIRFLDLSVAGRWQENDRIAGAFQSGNFVLLLLLILAGGLLLNLTPCVLPMIPVNIAIIGAGIDGSSRMRGLLLGTVYGAGMAFAYGVLGLVVALAGGKFGALNSSPVFNIAVAVIFAVLSLSMFGVFNLDFSALQARISIGGEKRGRMATAFFLGGVSALLAGACVAPVVISVLVLSADLYNKGNMAGLVFPFIMGVGMALPWPLAGAGLSFLPRPGRWMERIKFGFGVVILIAAFWYGRMGVNMALDRSESRRKAVEAAYDVSRNEGWFTDLAEALSAASRDRKPVFIDFWASWCKNCLKMESTTFKDGRVRDRLEGFVRVKCRAEELSNPATREKLDYLKLHGLPAFVVLQPAGEGR